MVNESDNTVSCTNGRVVLDTGGTMITDTVYQVGFSVTEDGLEPEKAYVTDAGFDLKCAVDFRIFPNERITVSTGLRISMPDNLCCLIWDRSGLASKNGITVLGGLVDPHYRGEIKVILLNTGEDFHKFKKFDRIAQAVFMPRLGVSLIKRDHISEEETSRGNNGFGSSGK